MKRLTLTSVVFLLAIVCAGLVACATKRPMETVTTTEAGLMGASVVTTVQRPYVSPEDQAHADAVRALFNAGGGL